MSEFVAKQVNKTQNFSSPYYNPSYQYTSLANKDDDGGKMNGSWKVITFCLLTAVLPTTLIIIPLYLRNIVYADVVYNISESDIIQIHKGQSSIFCEKHSLKMNSTFSAFQMKGRPKLSNERKHIRLKKSMSLTYETLEYWGFYLFKGATVELNACSQYEGSKILVVKGEKPLDTCGILDSNKYNKNSFYAENKGSVLVTLEKPNKTENQSDSNRDNHINNFSSSTTNQKPSKKFKRNIRTTFHNPNTVLDGGVHHGRNAFEENINSTPNSLTPFEMNLRNCYHGNIFMNEPFPHSIDCNGSYLEKTTTLKVVHDVLFDGYYYYIFYSNNDKRNDVNVIFDIFKPTFQYTNESDSKVCVNRSTCEFDIDLFSDELVIVEVPTKNGLRNKGLDSSFLISVCHPRTTVYVIFPIAVILLVLLFAFL